LPVAVAGDTVAVKEIGWPKTDGFADETNVVVVESVVAEPSSTLMLSPF
jgi:hypothetical protein